MRRALLVSVISSMMVFTVSCTEVAPPSPTPNPTIPPTAIPPTYTLTPTSTPTILPTATMTPDPSLTLLRDAGYLSNMIAYYMWALVYDISVEMEFPTELGNLYLRGYDDLHFLDMGSDLGNTYGLHWSPNGNWLSVYNYSGYKVEQDGDNGEVDGYSLWLLKPDGSAIRELFTSPNVDHLDWDITRGRIIANCIVKSDLYHICMAALENDDIILTGNSGYDPKFSPDGTHYAWHDKQSIWAANSQTHNPTQLFSVSAGTILGLDWDVDGSSILTGVLIEGKNFCDGDTTFYKVSIDHSLSLRLGGIKRYLRGWSLSPDRSTLLSESVLCVGNAYNLPILVSLDGEKVLWPFARHHFADYSWSPNGKYVFEFNNPSGIRGYYLIRAEDGISSHIEPFDWMIEILSSLQASNYSIKLEWEPQP